MKPTLFTTLLLYCCCPAVVIGFVINIKSSSRFHSACISHQSTAEDTSNENEPSLDQISIGSLLPQNPFLPLLSKGLHRVSLAIDKSTSDQVFLSTPSLQRLRQQIVQLTKVGPSSLGEHAGLGLFASKNIKVRATVILM